MKKLITLIRMQMGSVISFLQISTNKSAEQRKKNTSSLVILTGAFFLFSFISVTYNLMYGYVLNTAGKIDLLPGMMLAVVSMVTLITSVYKVNGILYGFKDYDIVMSYPVKTSTVVTCRMLLFYILNVFFVFIIMVPSFVVYGVFAKPDWYFYLTAIISFPFIPLIPMVLAAVVGTLVALISARFKKNNIVSIILMILVFIVIFAFSMVRSENQIVVIGEAVNEIINKFYPPAILYLEGICRQNLLFLFLFLLLSGLLFTVFCLIIGKNFRRINNCITSIRTKSHYIRKELKITSPVGALIKKEFRRLLSSVNYFMNASIGLIMLLLAAVALMIFKEDVITTLQSPEVMNIPLSLAPIATLVMCFSIGLVYTPACSLSLEGTSLWIIKTAPIAAKHVFRAKIYMNILLTLPVILISGTLFCISLKANLPEALVMFLLPVSFNIFISVIDMMINIRFAKFDWKNELAVIKQGMAAFLAFFIPMLILLPFIILFLISNMLFSISEELILFLYAVLFGGTALLMMKQLDKKAEEKMRHLI